MRLFLVLMTAAHISPNVFSLRNFLSNIHVLFFLVHSSSFILIIHHIQQAITSICYMINLLFHFFGSSWQAGCPRSLVSVTVVMPMLCIYMYTYIQALGVKLDLSQYTARYWAGRGNKMHVLIRRGQNRAQFKPGTGSWRTYSRGASRKHLFKYVQ
jgi:hypothetical protein